MTDIQGEPDGFTRKSIDRLNEAVLSGDVQRIEEAQYKALLDSVSLLGVVVNYLTLERAGCHFDFGSSTIKKGTVLYRVRDYKEGTNYSHPSAWALLLCVIAAEPTIRVKSRFTSLAKNLFAC